MPGDCLSSVNVYANDEHEYRQSEAAAARRRRHQNQPDDDDKQQTNISVAATTHR